ncbi:hypothetical protein B0I08_101130 [Glaciihabitans tibetensis]|uniref:Uncharacterized protein n=1 Tax=Glaciihabitans tibetensis TaxID=1266600 RepID=A0A2T0VIH1_9MICO|nr:hypothetical protein [Glaciihabitans tibetensis]PRY70008.1 hypothetical protein B0I08_101130 [Glaciihabitans tibetensis]
MSSVVPAVKLHLNKREMTFLVPLYIIGMVALISVLISLVFLRGGSVPGSEGWLTGSRNNPAFLWAFPGYLVYLGVQSIATTFPFALTLGATRRDFVAGTLLWAVLTSAYITVILAILTMIELATGHWWSGFHIFDIYILGLGDLSLLVPIVFLGSLTCLVVGGGFAASWVRWGARGPQLIATALGLVIVVGVIIVIPSAESIFASFAAWWLAVAAAVAIAISAVGAWLLLRPATVR